MTTLSDRSSILLISTSNKHENGKYRVFYIDSLIGFCNRSGYFRVNRGDIFLLGRFLSISSFSDIIQNGCLKRKDVGERIAKKTNCEL